jgi:hypothetical protein
MTHVSLTDPCHRANPAQPVPVLFDQNFTTLAEIIEPRTTNSVVESVIRHR